MLATTIPLHNSRSCVSLKLIGFQFGGMPDVASRALERSSATPSSVGSPPQSRRSRLSLRTIAKSCQAGLVSTSACTPHSLGLLGGRILCTDLCATLRGGSRPPGRLSRGLRRRDADQEPRKEGDRKRSQEFHIAFLVSSDGRKFHSDGATSARNCGRLATMELRQSPLLNRRCRPAVSELFQLSVEEAPDTLECHLSVTDA
jgi:hypothetical protein